ncbi:MAG: hypothetical protein IAA89_02355 [Firmicutes bacterium]|uniref:Uncharacterized protein n=1 Tax=Candidatus Gallilactobacillus intestinavium TaxID=2840838 RepID=A0A9D9H7S3_9LACO|nr:hypothetical protein [Candidatus Gallilactobacillus intestinavium]
MIFEKLINEFENLSSSVHKLKETISCGKYPNEREIPVVEMELLQKQLEAMQSYVKILMKRINLLMEKMSKGE